MMLSACALRMRFCNPNPIGSIGSNAGHRAGFFDYDASDAGSVNAEPERTSGLRCLGLS